MDDREYRANAMIAQNKLRHFGILGMKWGVRRYQNKDGSLTDAGRKRYGVAEEITVADKEDSDRGTLSSEDIDKKIKRASDTDNYDLEFLEYIQNDDELMEDENKQARLKAYKEYLRDDNMRKLGFRQDGSQFYTRHTPEVDVIITKFKEDNWSKVSYDEYLQNALEISNDEYVKKIAKNAQSIANKIEGIKGEASWPRAQFSWNGNCIITFTDSKDQDWMIDVDYDHKSKSFKEPYYH